MISTCFIPYGMLIRDNAYNYAYSINDCTKTMRDTTLKFSQIVDCDEINQQAKGSNFAKMGLDRVKVNRCRFVFLHVLYRFRGLCFSCSDRSFKYLSFDIKMDSVGLIGAEIRRFDPFGSEHFGLTSLTRISGPT